MYGKLHVSQIPCIKKIWIFYWKKKKKWTERTSNKVSPRLKTSTTNRRGEEEEEEEKRKRALTQCTFWLGCSHHVIEASALWNKKEKNICIFNPSHRATVGAPATLQLIWVHQASSHNAPVSPATFFPFYLQCVAPGDGGLGQICSGCVQSMQQRLSRLRDERVRATEGRWRLFALRPWRAIRCRKKKQKLKQPKGNMADLYLHTLTESGATLQLWALNASSIETSPLARLM